eukprot:991744-Pelagomonas_calceolata.AAC.1
MEMAHLVVLLGHGKDLLGHGKDFCRQTLQAHTGLGHWFLAIQNAVPGLRTLPNSPAKLRSALYHITSLMHSKM